uniref:TonB-dependent receptor n=1 Tax=uncultured Sphingomonas sp. TaxID=158754 RepID=UPI0035C9969F
MRDTSLRAVAVAPALFRLERRPPHDRNPALPTTPEPTLGGDIIVTATKQSMALRDSPFPLAVRDTAALETLGDAVDTASLAGAITGLSVTNLGAGRDRLFVRGVADSPFDGFGQASVSVQIDDARATYDAPDPDLRLIDMAQVELLKGPQGPLYGSGALGGVYRLVPAKPDLDSANGWAQIGLESTSHGGVAGSAEAVANVPLLSERVALRAVAYRVGQAGWIDDASGARDVNHGQTTGGRLTLRTRIGSDWTVDVSGLAQFSSVADSQYVSASRPTLTRATHLPEPQDTDFSLVDIAATGTVLGTTFTGSASLANQQLQATYDASSAATLFGATPPATYRDDRRYQVVNAEARLSSAPARLGWLAGASLLSATTDASGTLNGASTSSKVLEFQRRITEVALYGEGTAQVTKTVRATLGARVFASAIDDERRQADAVAGLARSTIRLSPSATLNWQPEARLLVFARYASALRPGGVDTTGQARPAATTYEADELQSYDLGARWSGPHHALTLDADLFEARWQHVQADYLGTNGLVTTRNAGDANNYGIDLSLSWTPTPDWTLGFGAVAQHARIDPSASIVGDLRLPVVPDLSGHLELSHRFDVRAWRFQLGGRATYTGDGRLSFDPGLDRKTDEVFLLTTSLTGERAAWRWRLGIDNLLDDHSDSFAFGNPFSVRAADQRTPVKPRTITISLRRRW